MLSLAPWAFLTKAKAQIFYTHCSCFRLCDVIFGEQEGSNRKIVCKDKSCDLSKMYMSLHLNLSSVSWVSYSVFTCFKIMHLERWRRNPAQRGSVLAGRKSLSPMSVGCFLPGRSGNSAGLWPSGTRVRHPWFRRKKRLQGLADAVGKNHDFLLTYGSVKCFLWSLNHNYAQLGPQV